MKIRPMISMLGFPNRVAWLLLLLVLGVVASSASRIAYAGYADGTGTGQYQNQIYWLDWAGFSFTNGNSKTFNLPGDVTIIATVSNISGGAVRISRPEDYADASFNRVYPNTGQTAINSCDSCTNRFRLTLTANVAGTPVPVDMVVADAEAASPVEYFTVTTDGNAWQLLEQFQAANLRATWSNNDKTLELHGNGSTTYGTALGVSTNVSNFDFELKGGGVSAAALGVFLPSDYGDAPASFGDAGHYIRQVFTGGLPGSTKVYDPVSTAFTSFATVSDAPTVFLGPIKPDGDPGTQNAAPNATNALGDNLNNTNDEDGVASFPPLTQASTSYSYSVSATAHNTSGGPATLWGWIDFNGDGQFSAAEAASATVANGANPASVTLNWPTVSVTPAIGSTVYARLRLTTGALTGNSATGGAADGEVEDYALRILGDYGDAPKDMSSIDAALSNAYPTLLADNGPRHTPVNGIYLGTLIDTESDGQPNLAANGDDINNLADEDGVAFNPTLGITTANVILSGVANNLIVTPSTGGYLSAWIDYNQNGNFTDAGEQLFNDQAVTAGTNALTFTTPDTAPHGATYMRFRYSTQSGVANTVTGLAPDGEVEDYRVEVTLPAPTTCDADLVNGSFETPAGGGLYPETEVPGWGFRATNPASGTGFDQRHIIEIWSGSNPPAYEGSQFAEINGYVAGALYQEMITVPGQVMLWQFAHRGRQGTDVMALKIGPPGATVEVTRATDGTSAWNLYKGSYTVPAGQTITRFEFEAISSTGGDASIGNFIDAVHFSLPCDFGDAPDSYGTSKAANGANHLLADLLHLGALTDAEGSGFPSVNADGDNLNNTNDEESVAALSPLNQANTAYTLSAIPVLNNSGSAATLYGWIDLNRNGQFEAGEGTSASVPSNAAAQAITLNWSGLSGLVAGQSYLRLRLSNQSGLSATGIGGAGEVEDYPLTISVRVVPGTLVAVKQTTGGDGAFSFTSQTLGSFVLTTTNGAAQQSFANLIPGTYDLAESLPAGWRLDSATCDNGDSPASVAVGAGETITCTFSNTRLDTIIVVKRAVGGDDMFPFTSQTLGNFTIQTVKGEGQKSFSNLAPGIYDLSESVPAGWTLSGATCSDGSPLNKIDLRAGETVVCVFIDLKKNTLVVRKETQGADGSFDFVSPELGNFTLTTVNGVASQNFPGLITGTTYSLSEALPAGWSLSASCDNGDSPAKISFAGGETITCTFVNTKLDTITVVKRAVGGDGTFPFTSQTLGDFTIKTVKGEGQKSFSNLAPGIYDLSESVPAGWTLSGATCSDGSPLNKIDLRAGETVLCTFIDLKKNTLIVKKETQGADGSFDFVSPELGNFTLTTVNGVASQSFPGLITGTTYSLSEVIPTGWSLSATCDNGDSPAQISFAGGETITCTFVNIKQDTITVVKRAVGGDGLFPFTSQTLGDFTIQTVKGEGQKSFSNLAPGIYDLSESVPAGWTLSGATCSDGSPLNKIDLRAGETVVCVFIDLKKNTLVVRKETQGADGSFDFVSPELGNFTLTTVNGVASQSFPGLITGTTYSLSEVLPTGWSLSATCDNGDSPAKISFAGGETITCTFVNIKQDTITVVKRAVGGDGLFPFTSQTLGNFTIQTVKGEGQKSFSNLVPGLYDLSETVPAGWTLSGATCSNGSPLNQIDLRAGETVVCVFIDLKQDTLIVEKRTVGGDGIFAFTSANPQIGAFNLITSSGIASRSFPELAAGTYAITETVPAGWAQTRATCDNGDSPGSVRLAPGVTVKCTFENTQQDTIIVVKHAVGGDGIFPFVSRSLGTFNLKTVKGEARRGAVSATSRRGRMT